ncbi:iron complex transport system substrate-binding protein [Paenibacillus phyllosphaerae]|uniref:Iron complex transport system substrate-binding protein n=1 Tax=Paenibacillus phyllosphaerae TaxID=274593 RepID=A0A7W5AVC8_9BACL|nr:ABC transporter substrate-binding protein [Paenibacillus phyllosphaerae]MBB3109485.1 iron complex transport system substrate-binding protein [Paenibacillus phyllosphaerae]
MKRSAMMRLSQLLLAMMLLVVMAACGSKADNNGNEAANTTNQTTNTANQTTDETDTGGKASTVYPLTLTDATNTEVTFDAAPQKVVTLVPSETEVLYAIGAGEQVAGVDDYSNYPAEAASKPKVGGMEANIESIVGLKPDLVLASSTMNTAVIEKLRGLNIKVYASDPKTYETVMEKVATIGAIMDKASEAAEVIQHMQDVKEQVQSAVKDAAQPKVYLEFSPGWTVGKGEFLDEIITMAGGVNIADQQSWYEIDPEKVIAANPDVIIYASMTVKEGEKNPILAAIESRPGWEAIAAIKNKQLYEIEQDPLVRVGPRLADGLLEVAKKLHPDLVK